MARLFSVKPPLTLKGRGFKGIRGWAGKPTHPPLTDIPVACYVLAAALDLLSFIFRGSSGSAGTFSHNAFVAGTFVMIAGGIVSLPTALTGFWDWWKGIDREPGGLFGKAHHTQVWRTINTHMTIMLTVTALVVVDIILRIAAADRLHTTVPVLILSLVIGALVFVGATFGGSLVYDYQFNVESLDGTTVWDETETDQLPSDKPQSGW